MPSLRDYVVITATYWAFTLTDGALRMLVLLYLHQQGRSPIEIASMFLFYEFFGVVTNLLGGWIGARFGLKSTLFNGLLLQIVACLMLTADARWLSVGYVMVAQGLSGIAKDLTKMSSKSYIKLVVAEEDQHGLMKWVSILTGSKNALKGVGFFMGGLLLALLGFRWACAAMAGGLAAALAASYVMLPRAAGKAKGKVSLGSVFSKDSRLNWLAAGRFFLFGSRDIWFVLALPLFLAVNLGWSSSFVGGFLAVWVIGYGIVQASAPRFVGGRKGDETRAAVHPPDAKRLSGWTASLIVPLGAIVAGLLLGARADVTLIAGLAVFGVLFAFNSAIHSYLVIRYAESEKVALNVGFYYMANAGGRLAGTVLSGALFQWAGQGDKGLLVCLIGSIVFVAASLALCVPLRRAERAVG